MKMLRGFVAVLLLSGILPQAWAQADPIKEVAAIYQKRGPALAKGDLDGFMAHVADNVVYTPGAAGFRIEGKAAMRRFFASLIQHYPTREFLVRQVSYRVYQNGTVVVRNHYQDGTSIDRNGYITRSSSRVTAVWIRIDGQWLLVEQHVSRVPGTQ
jgi:uncharacterized protein (TIGR02246 family)